MERKKGSNVKLMYCTQYPTLYKGSQIIGGAGTPLILHISYSINVDHSNKK